MNISPACVSAESLGYMIMQYTCGTALHTDSHIQ